MGEPQWEDKGVSQVTRWEGTSKGSAKVKPYCGMCFLWSGHNQENTLDDLQMADESTEREMTRSCQTFDCSMFFYE